MRIRHKEAIAMMRAEGHSYQSIANALGLPMGTVKSHLQRHPLPLACMNCGADFFRRNKRQKFCTPACRVSYWNSHLDQVKRRAYYNLQCQHCGKEFESYGNDRRKFCSRACYDQARKRPAV